jgi:hypothetical protein
MRAYAARRPRPNRRGHLPWTGAAALRDLLAPDRKRADLPPANAAACYGSAAVRGRATFARVDSATSRSSRC